MSIALVDGNSFYCSCERLFDPSLRGRPLIVLSNNDGCAIARTDEAKAMGIRMGDPWFEIRDTHAGGDLAVRSSNYALYADISARLNAVYRNLADEVETYSIDESFLSFEADGRHARWDFAAEVRRMAMDWVGIPTCVGVGPTKTLAKLANRIAKRERGRSGVIDLTDSYVRDAWFTLLPASDVWGVGQAAERRLAEVGVETVQQLRDMDETHARRLLTVVGERTVLELRGIPCLPLELVEPTRKGLVVSRSFGRPVDTVDQLVEAVASFVSRLGEKLRSNGLETTDVTVFAHPPRSGPGERSLSAPAILLDATDDTMELTRACSMAVRSRWIDGTRFGNAGVSASDLIPRGTGTSSLFGSRDRERSERLMTALDGVNSRHGRGSLVAAATGPGRPKPWAPRSNIRSPRWTTRIAELPVARS